MRCKGCKECITKDEREFGFHIIFNGKNYHSFCIPDEPGIITIPSLERWMKDSSELDNLLEQQKELFKNFDEFCEKYGLDDEYFKAVEEANSECFPMIDLADIIEEEEL